VRGVYNVKKKSGMTEPFDRSKVAGGVVRAGGTAEIAEQVATEVEAWLPTAAVDETVEAEQIRLKVIEVLKQIDPATAASFEAFKKVAEAGGV